MSELSGRPLVEVAAAVASAGPLPAGGSSAAVAGALAAALVEQSARVAVRRVEDDAAKTRISEMSERATTLRGELLELADRDVAAGTAGLAGDASGESVDVPLAIASAASETALFAAELAGLTPGHVRADAVTALLLAEAATAAAAGIVATNLAGSDDPRGPRAAEHARRAGEARRRGAAAL